jgi:hypothetical protein
VERLRRGEMAPRDVSPYLVRALGGHLARAGAGPEDWLRLVHGAWAGANEALEGAYSLFLHDVTRAWRACAAADREATARGEPAPYLGGEVRCALVEASLHSLAGNIPPALLAALVEKGLWTPRPGAWPTPARCPNEWQQAEALAKLTPTCRRTCCPRPWPPPGKSRECECPRPRPDRPGGAPAGSLARSPGRRKGNQKGVVPRFRPDRPGGAPSTCWLQALAAAREIGDESARARALAALAPHLPRPAGPGPGRCKGNRG